MAVPHITTSLAISIAGLAVVSAFSIPAIYQYISRLRQRKAQGRDVSDRYEDEDGVATQESEEAYHDFTPRLLLILVSVVACIDALVAAVLTTARPHLSLALEEWLQFATWVSLLGQNESDYPLTPIRCWSCSKPSPSLSHHPL